MKMPSLNIVLVTLGIFVIGLAVYALVPPEPSYQGRTVQEWLGEFDKNPLQAGEAIRRLGTATLPFLMNELQTKDSQLKLKLVALARQQSLVKIQFTPDTLRRDRAIQACAALGSLAKPAIPALGEALGYGSSRAVQVLEKFGPAAVPALANALTNAPGCGTPYSTAIALGRMGAKARMAVTNLCWEFEHYTIAYPRAESAIAMARICEELIEKENQPGCDEVRFAKPALIQGLSNSNLWVRRGAAMGLAVLKANAKEAAPALQQLLHDPDAQVRQSATNVLEAIDPHAVTRVAANATADSSNER